MSTGQLPQHFALFSGSPIVSASSLEMPPEPWKRLEVDKAFPFRTERSLSSQHFDQLCVFTLTAAHSQKKFL